MKGLRAMDPTVVQYIGFGVVILILIWATVEMSRRYSRHRKMSINPLDAWVRMDSPHVTPTEEPLPATDTGEQEETPEENIHTRAQQNGHYSESKKPL
jgi:hypothetical protein